MELLGHAGHVHSYFCSNFACFGSKTEFLILCPSGSAWFYVEESKTHSFSMKTQYLSNLLLKTDRDPNNTKNNNETIKLFNREGCMLAECAGPRVCRTTRPVSTELHLRLGAQASVDKNRRLKHAFRSLLPHRFYSAEAFSLNELLEQRLLAAGLRPSLPRARAGGRLRRRGYFGRRGAGD